MRFNNKNIVLPEKIITYYLYDYIHMDATDYAQSKKSYIDLDYVPTLTTNVEITFKLSDDFNAGDTYFFGMNGNQALYYPDGGYGARIRTNTSPDYYFEPCYGGNNQDRATEILANQDYTVRFDQTTTSNHFALYKDGVEVTIINWSLASSLQNLSLFLFATNNPSGTYNYAHPNEWVKEIKIYEGTTLVRDYKPALHVGSNQPCLVDVLHETHFYFATGTGKMALEGPQVL